MNPLIEALAIGVKQPASLDPVADAQEKLRRALMASRAAGAPVDLATQQPRKQSAGGALTTNAQPREIQPGEGNIRRALELYGKDDDYTEARAYAAQRASEGESALINALAAGYAGERLAPVQSMYLKRAETAREPLKVGGAVISPDGTVMRDPSAARQREADKLLQLGQFEMTLDDRRQARELADLQRRDLSAANASRRDDERRFTNATKLRGELTQRLDKVAAGSSFAENVLAMLADPEIAKNPTKQVTLVTAFGKMLDPESVVRESEYAMIANARGAFENVIRYPERITSGTALSPDQLRSMRDVARNLYSGSQQRKQDVLEYYRGIAERNNVPVDDVLPFGSSYQSADGASAGAAKRIRFEDLQP